MLDRFNRANRRRRDKEHRSNLETQVEEALKSQGLSPQYETDKFGYVLHRKYTPDFSLVDRNGQKFYIEVKGWWEPSSRSKFLAVILNNPTLPIFVALQRPLQTLSKKSKTTYAAWCNRYGIAWCPTPIPEEFMNQWLDGSRPTYRAPGAKAATQQLELTTTASTASVAKGDSTTKGTPGDPKKGRAA